MTSTSEGMMIASERAAGRAEADKEELGAKLGEAGGAVSERVHEAQVQGLMGLIWEYSMGWLLC